MIKDEKQYRAVMARIDELLQFVGNHTSEDDKDYIELMLLTDLAEAYETVHYPIETPALKDALKFTMHEMGITQAKMGEMIGVSPPRMSDYISGRSEPTLKVAKAMHRNLGISAAVILG